MIHKNAIGILMLCLAFLHLVLPSVYSARHESKTGTPGLDPIAEDLDIPRHTSNGGKLLLSNVRAISTSKSPPKADTFKKRRQDQRAVSAPGNSDSERSALYVPKAIRRAYTDPESCRIPLWYAAKIQFMKKYQMISALISEYPSFGKGKVKYLEFIRHLKQVLKSTSIALPTSKLFTIDDKIGKGSFGKVYKGTYAGQGIAIKQTKKFKCYVTLLNELRLITHLFTADPYNAKKYLVPICALLFPADESRELDKVEFSNAYLMNSGLPLLVYELYDTDLEKFAKKILVQYPEDKKEAILREIMKRLLHASMFLRRNNVVHDDLKCDNILVNYKKGELQVFITDFGIGSIGASLYCKMDSDVDAEGGLVHERDGHCPATDICNLGQTMLEVIRWAWIKHNSAMIKVGTRMMEAKKNPRITAEEILAMSWFTPDSSDSLTEISDIYDLSLYMIPNISRILFENRLVLSLFMLLGLALYFLVRYGKRVMDLVRVVLVGGPLSQT